jgi:nucleotide-binding universal stress UspA family protein
MIASVTTSIDRLTAQPVTSESSWPGKAALAETGSAGSLAGARRLLLATDLSVASGAAADEAIRLAAESGAQLVVLSVIDPGGLRLPGGKFLRRVDQERARIDAAVQGLVSRARAAGAQATFLVWEGDPSEAILEASESEHVDLIIMGSHGRGLLGRLVMGSTSVRVSETARCRVLIIAA